MKARPGVRRMVGLTGTPSSNGLMDLWAEFRVLDMGKRLGWFITHYREQFFEPDRRNGMQVFSYKPRAGAECEIYRRIGDITISMRSTDYLKMPECVMNTVPVTLDSSEFEIYEEMESKMVTELGVLGTVLYVDDMGTIHVSWDCGSSLGVVLGEDSCTRIDEEHAHD